MKGLGLLMWGAMGVAGGQGHLGGADVGATGNSGPADTIVRVLAWNLFDVPELFFPVGSHARMAQVAPALSHAQNLGLEHIDALVLTELYNGADRRLVLRQLADLGFVHHAELGRGPWWTAWRMLGVVVVSRWPLERVASMPFVGACHGLDCFAAKGCLYVRFLKPTLWGARAVNLFAAHFYLGKPGARQAARRQQAEAMRQFIAAQAPAHDEVTLVAGDFNAPWHQDGPEVLAALGAFAVQPSGTWDHTFVGEGHVLAGSPRKSVAERARAVRAPGTPNSGAGRKWIDYVAAVRPGLGPKASVLTAFNVRGAPYVLGEAAGTPLVTDALSDHYPVLGTLHFGAPSAAGAAAP